MRRILLFLSILFITASIYGRPVGELGAWDDVNGGGMGIGYVVMVILGFLMGIFFIGLWIESAKKKELDGDTNKWGCFGVILILGTILSVYVCCS